MTDKIDDSIVDFIARINQTGICETIFSCEGHDRTEDDFFTFPYVSMRIINCTLFLNALCAFLYKSSDCQIEKTTGFYSINFETNSREIDRKAVSEQFDMFVKFLEREAKQ